MNPLTSSVGQPKEQNIENTKHEYNGYKTRLGTFQTQ